MPNGINTIQISDDILKNSQNTLDNLPTSVSLIKISVDKLFFEFIKVLITEIREIDSLSTEKKNDLKNSNNLIHFQRTCEIFDITNKIKLPFGCELTFCYD